MLQSWNLLALEADRFDPIEETRRRNDGGATINFPGSATTIKSTLRQSGYGLGFWFGLAAHAITQRIRE